MLELLFAIAVLLLIVFTTTLILHRFSYARQLEASTENLVSFIRNASSIALETETVHAIFVAYNKVGLVRYPGKELKEVQIDLSPEAGEIISSQKFKNKIICSNMAINGELMTVPRELEDNVAILVNEKGEFQSSTIVLAGKEERKSIITNGKKVGIENIENDELPVVTLVPQEPQEIVVNEPSLIAKTEPLMSNGWQTVNINNVDKVKEVRLRVKLDHRIPESAHLHVYVFPGKNENRNVAIGSLLTGRITGKVYDTDYGFSQGGIGLVQINFYKDNQLMGTTYSNAYGNYNMTGLPYGTYTIIASLLGYGNTTLTGIAFSENIKTVNIPMSPFHYTISGTVTDKSTGGFISGAKVSLLSGGGEIPINYTQTNLSGFYKFENLLSGYYQINVSADGYSEDTKYQNIPLNELPGGHTVDFSLDPKHKSPSLPSSSLLENEQVTSRIFGDWNHSNEYLITKTAPASVPVFSNPIVYCLYKNKTEQFSSFMQEFPSLGTPINFRYTGIIKNQQLNIYEFSGQMTSLNSCSNTGSSSFPCGPASLTLNVETGYLWSGGYVSSKLASSTAHSGDLKDTEIEPAEYSSWLVIKLSDLPQDTTFLRIAISAYHREEKDKDKAFNLYPSSNSKHENELFVDSLNLDYQTDPMIVTYSWLKWGNDPFWLSHYGYMLKPLIRSNSLSILATKGPFNNENYYNYSDHNEYKNHWYGPVLLDWDKILGEEGILWLLGWTSSTYEFKNWKYTQAGDTYGSYGNWEDPTHAVPPSHYWLKSFGMLSYWYIFNYANFFPPQDVPKRIQLPLNLLTQENGSLFEIWERNICQPAPYESSSLSISLMAKPNYPVWNACFPPIFGTQKIICSPDLYSSYFYIMQRISHIMLDTSAYILCTTTFSDVKNNCWNVWNNASNGNLDKWRIEIENINDGLQNTYPYPRATWWQWYTNLPWAKGVAFPIPSNLTPREGWEAPVVEAYPPDSLFLQGASSYSNYRALIKNQPNTIYLSTSHYPLGSIEIAVKKK